MPDESLLACEREQLARQGDGLPAGQVDLVEVEAILSGVGLAQVGETGDGGEEV